MTPSRTGRSHSLWVFILILIIGAVAITAAYRQAVMHPVAPPVLEEISERQKELIKAQQEMSKWLLGIASGALVGVVGLRLRNPRDESLMDPASMSAYAFLLLSLYGGYLCYQTVFDILQRGPLSYFYGDALRAPVLMQFWALMAALVLLAGTLLRNRSSALTLALLVCIPWAGAHGQTPEPAQPVDQQRCIREWFADRLGAGDADAHEAMAVLTRISHLQSARAIGQCVDVYTVFDSLRLAAVNARKPDDEASFVRYLHSINDAMSHPELSMSEVVHGVLELMQPWSPHSAVLSVRSKRGTCDIYLQGVKAGLTNWDVRLAPGVYRLRIVRRGELIYKADDLRLDADQSRLIDLDQP